jgi:hypothetical protein
MIFGGLNGGGGAVNPILSVQVLLKFGDFCNKHMHKFAKSDTHAVTAGRWWNYVQTDIVRCRIKNWKLTYLVT